MPTTVTSTGADITSPEAKCAPNAPLPLPEIQQSPERDYEIIFAWENEEIRKMQTMIFDNYILC